MDDKSRASVGLGIQLREGLGTVDVGVGWWCPPTVSSGLPESDRRGIHPRPSRDTRSRISRYSVDWQSWIIVAISTILCTAFIIGVALTGGF